MSANQRSREKKRAKRKRGQARGKGRRREAQAFAPFVDFAVHAPFGPCWISDNIWDLEVDQPVFLSVMVTHKMPKGLLLGHHILVDPTCLGVREAMVMPPLSEDVLVANVLHHAQPANMVRCEPHFAQSVVYHAIDYARSLGFEPHPGLEPGLLGQRPQELDETPLLRPSKPIYVSAPDDDEDEILAKLEQAVGPDGYVVIGEDASEA